MPLDGPPPSPTAPPTLFSWDVVPDGACGVTANQRAAVRDLADALMAPGASGDRGTIRRCRPSMSGTITYVYISEVAKATRVAGNGVVWTGL